MMDAAVIGEDTFEFRRLGQDDVGAAVRLHEEAVAESRALGLGVLIGWHDRRYFEENIDESGFVLGCFQAGRQVGYCSVRFPGTKEVNFGAFIGLAGEEFPHVAHLNGAYVQASVRGRGLHNLMAQRRRSLAIERGIRHFLVEIHVNNGYSLKTQFDLGLAIRTMTRDGADHYFLLHAEASCSPGEQAPIEHVVHAHDIARHLELTSSGYRGTGCQSRFGQTWIEYAHHSKVESASTRCNAA